MTNLRLIAELVLTAFQKSSGDHSGAEDDYTIHSALEHSFVARSRDGCASLLVPLEAAPSTATRSGGGFRLVSSQAMTFEHGERRWQQPAAVLECIDSRLLETFAAFCADLEARLRSDRELRTWNALLTWIGEWQLLLGRKIRLSPEAEMGLWGELWLISQASNVDLLVEAWRGPEHAPIDIFVSETGLEIKTSRARHAHHISQTQVNMPAGLFQCYFVSLWVAIDPVRGQSIPDLAEKLLQGVSDGAGFLRKLSRAGYSPVDQDDYRDKYLLLESPALYPVEAVPRVRLADKGVSNLRYRVSLEDVESDQEPLQQIWLRTLGRIPEIESSKGE